jgi:hypothetical protein
MKRMKIRENFIRMPVILMIGALILTIIPSLSLPKMTQAAPAGISTPGKTQILKMYGRLPLRFEVNQGQSDSQVRYLSRNSGYDLFLTPDEAVMVLHRQQTKRSTGGTASGEAKADKADVQTSNVVRMQLVGANPEPIITGRNKLAGKSHYFIGNDKKRWHTNIPQYARVAYEGVYPGIDLAFYGTNRQLEYDFIVMPGADPKKIMIAFSGMDTLALGKNGDLILRMGSEKIIHRAPNIYQELNGKKQTIKGHYVLYAGNRAGFHVARYDTQRPLVIDPELTYSTYLGGGGSDSGYSIAIDSSGNAYITGTTSSGNFPTTLNPYQDINNSNFDAIVTKLNSDGSALLFSTYFGGSGIDEGYGIAVDASDYVYVTGSTTSLNFPTESAIQGTIGGGSDAFITKFNSTGSALEYSTYHGGSFSDVGYGIAVDSSEAYVTGMTDSNNFPKTGATAQDTLGGGQDAFVTKVNAGGTALTYSTYLGGSFDDYGQSIAVDSSGSAYVTGRTVSIDFPTPGTPYQSARAGGNDAFVTKVNSDGTAFTYSTYLGGTLDDYGQSIAIDTSGNAYVAGGTFSSDFPTQGTPVQSSNAGGLDVFVTKLNSTGSSPLVYSTYLGGNNTDEGYGIAVDGNNYAYVTGRTSSSDLPTTTNAVQRTLSGGAGYDAFIAKFNTTGSFLSYLTYLGGSNDEYGQSIAVDSSENVYVTGYTDSGNFPTAGMPPYQSSSGSGRDAFVTKSTTTDPPTPPPSPPDSDDNCFIDTVFRR